MPIVGAALISGLCAYLPPLLSLAFMRGALFCLFPGIAHRSRKIVGKGFLYGFLADLAFHIVWFYGLSWVWEPRSGYNVALAQWLGPGHVVCTHCNCPIPNKVQFLLGLIWWTNCMFVVWLWLWKPRISLLKAAGILIVGSVCVGSVAQILWVVAPMDHWWRYGAQPYGDLPLVPFAVVFLASMPLCCLVVGYLIERSTRNTEAR